MTTKAQHFNRLVRICMDSKKPSKVDLDRLAAALHEVSETIESDFRHAAFMLGVGRNMEAMHAIESLEGRVYRQFPKGDFRERVTEEYLKQTELPS